MWPCKTPPSCTHTPLPSQARESAGDELDDLVSAPRMVLQQYIDKWFPDDPADLPRMSDRAIKKLLLDVSVLCFFSREG